MAEGAWRCDCGAVNGKRRQTCRDCDRPRPGGDSVDPKAPEPGRCWLDGSMLDAEGRCEATGGYPVPKDGSPLTCPYSCPVCRTTLSWDGGCWKCHGSLTGRAGWTFPGDRYELVNGHRVSQGGAGRAAVSWEENRERSALLVRLTGGIGRGAPEEEW